MSKRNIELYLDTSTSKFILGVVEDKKLLKQLIEKEEKDMSKVSIINIKNSLDELNLTPKDIICIITNVGPGSFTGTRLGNTICKTMAYSLDIPIKKITSLNAMAISTNIDTIKVPIILDKNDYIYCAIYDKDNNIILKESYIDLDNLLKKIKEINKKSTFIIQKEELEKLKEKNIEKIEIVEYNPNILEIINYSKNINITKAHDIEPYYLKKVSITKKEKQ